MLDDFVALLPERSRPLIDRAAPPRIGRTEWHARRFEHVADLLVRELREQVGEERPALLGDAWMLEAACR